MQWVVKQVLLTSFLVVLMLLFVSMVQAACPPDAECSQYIIDNFDQNGACPGACPGACQQGGCCDSGAMLIWHRCVCNPETEVCDGYDNNCDGKVDHEDPTCTDCDYATCEYSCSVDGGYWEGSPSRFEALTIPSCCEDDPGETFGWYRLSTDANGGTIEVENGGATGCCNAATDCVSGGSTCYADGDLIASSTNMCDNNIWYECNPGRECDSQNGKTCYRTSGDWKWRATPPIETCWDTYDNNCNGDFDMNDSQCDPDLNQTLCEAIPDAVWYSDFDFPYIYHGVTQRSDCCGDNDPYLLDDVGKEFPLLRIEERDADPTPEYVGGAKFCCDTLDDCIDGTTGPNDMCRDLYEVWGPTSDWICGEDDVVYHCNIDTECLAREIDGKRCYFTGGEYGWHSSTPSETCGDGHDNDCVGGDVACCSGTWYGNCDNHNGCTNRNTAPYNSCNLASYVACGDEVGSCDDGVNSDCDASTTEFDYDTMDRGSGGNIPAHGDSDCPVGVSAPITANPISQVQGGSVDITVRSTVGETNAIFIYRDDNDNDKYDTGEYDCGWNAPPDSWSGSDATFHGCDVGPDTGSNVTFRASVYDGGEKTRNRAYMTGGEVEINVTVTPSICVSYGNQPACEADLGCCWQGSVTFPLCNATGAWSGSLSPECLNDCSTYQCKIGQCGAQCDGSTSPPVNGVCDLATCMVDCNSGFIYNTTTGECDSIPGFFSCLDFNVTHVTPENAVLCAGDDLGLTANTASTLVDNGDCSVPAEDTKCEYECDTDYSLIGGVCVYTALPKICGDGTTDTPNDAGQNEECDDANDDASDGCIINWNAVPPYACMDAECGDGYGCEDPGCTSGPTGGIEECDDGNTDDTDGCHNDCSDNAALTDTYCGDLTWQPQNDVRDGGVLNNGQEECDGDDLALCESGEMCGAAGGPHACVCIPKGVVDPPETWCGDNNLDNPIANEMNQGGPADDGIEECDGTDDAACISPTICNTLNCTCGTVSPGDLNGTVYQKITGSPLAGVTVSVVAPPAGYFSDPTPGTGKYSIADIPIGVHQISASKAGYRSVTVPFPIVSGNNILNFNLSDGDCEACADWEGRCSVSCGGVGECAALNDEVPPDCEGARPGEWVLNASENGYIQCCEGSRQRTKTSVPAEVSGCMDELVKHTRIVYYLGQPVTLEVYTWKPCS